MTTVPARHTVALDGVWSFAHSTRPLTPIRTAAQLAASGLDVRPATVPGNFELDLLRHGTIDEPFYGMNITQLAKFEHEHVCYHRTFDASEVHGATCDLVFEGLDCFADIYLNGELLGTTDNMLVPHSFRVDGLLEPTNELMIQFRPAIEAPSRYDYAANLFAQPQCYESLYVRKAPHMYGWDIMPRAISAGIWRSVKLEYRPQERVERIAIDTLSLSADHARATLSFAYTCAISPTVGDEYVVRASGTCDSSSYFHEARALSANGRIKFEIEYPKLWWPKGRGEASLYTGTIKLLKNGIEIDHMTVRHGIRTVKLVTSSVTDKHGRGEFCFWINGEKIFILGTNWVPMDAFHSRDLARIPAALKLVSDIGCNMIRCWGGNVYENDLFYDRCDETGVLVWQDFAMACALYPQDTAFQGRIETEAHKVVRRLRNHPCLALWAGDNECDEASQWSGLSSNPDDNVLTRTVLPEVIRQESFGIPYLPSSPYIDKIAFNGGNFLPTPESHLWGPRNYYKSEFYTEFVSHFASEMGYHGCPSVESLARFLSPNRMWPYQDNPEWVLHSTSPIPGVDIYDYRVELMATQIRAVFGQVPNTLADYVFASQAVQAEAFKFFIESFRVWKWRRTGIIWWNLIDGWPQLSDAVVDYYYDKKLAYDYIKRAQAPLLLAFREPAGSLHELVAVNDTRNDIAVTFAVIDIETREQILTGTKVVSGDSAAIIGQITYDDTVQRVYKIDWSSALGDGASHYLAGKPPFDVTRYKMRLTSTGLLNGQHVAY